MPFYLKYKFLNRFTLQSVGHLLVSLIKKSIFKMQNLETLVFLYFVHQELSKFIMIDVGDMTPGTQSWRFISATGGKK